MENPESWFSAGIIARGEEVLVVQVFTRSGKPKFKFPGGKQETETRFDPCPEATLCAEIQEEILERGEVIRARKFFSQKKSSSHTQHFFEVGLSDDAELRRTIMKTDRQAGQPDEDISPPFFLNVRVAYEKLIPAHRNALEAYVLERSARRDGGWTQIAVDLGLFPTC